MAGVGRLSFCVVVVSVLAASSVSAFGGRFGPWNAPATVHDYYAVPSTYWVAPYYYCPPMPGPRVIAVPDAQPTPAPPSPTGEPPLQKGIEKKVSNDPRMPVIVTSHAVGGNYVPGTAPLAKDRCRVGFWNLSGREVTLMIDGKSWHVAKDRAVTLDLERQFTWQIEGRPSHSERIGEAQASHEIVIRE